MPYSAFSPRARARNKLTASIRKLYEDTRVPVREIAKLAGVTERYVYILVRRLGCRPRGRLALPAEERINARVSAACRRAAQRRRKLAALARAELARQADARGAQAQRDANVRLLLRLTQALRELNRLDEKNAARADTRANLAAADAADLDRRRRELARRIANLADDAPAADRSAATEPIGQPRLPGGARIRLLSD